jgi:hypothetical protein
VATIGGIIGYPLDRLYEEVAYVAFHLHWSFELLMTLDHRERIRWVQEVVRINQRLNEHLEPHRLRFDE